MYVTIEEIKQHLYYPKSNIIQSVNYTHLNHNKIKG